MLTATSKRRTVATGRILLALGVSVLLHFFVLAKSGGFSSNEIAASGLALQISLVVPADRAPAPDVAEVLSPAPAIELAREIELAKEIEPPRPAPVVPAKPAEPVAPRPLPAPTVASPAPEPTPAPAVTVASPSAKGSPQTEQKPGIPWPGQGDPVKRVEIEFEIFSGADRQSVGFGKHLYVADNAGRFRVSVEQRLNGAESAQELPWRLEISGNVHRNNLFPIAFKMQGAVAERLLALKSSAESRSTPSTPARSGRMPDGILDRQSLLYRFMLRPPELAGGELMLTDGVIYSRYSYRLAGGESLPIASFGVAHTVKLVLTTSDSGETIELWLVPDLHFLPVKVRHSDTQGVVTEQLATSLDFK